MGFCMKNSIRIEDCRIDEEQRLLHLELSGNWIHPVPSGRLRLSAVFQGHSVDRHYPLFAHCEQNEEGETIFHLSVQIQLEYVFYQYRREGEKTVSLRFACCDLKEKWVCFQETVSLPAVLFEKRQQSAEGKGVWWRRVKYVFCTLLLPVWLFDGYLAMKGRKPLHPAAQERMGKGAMLYHAHGLVKDLTGYGYSVREMKTEYFRMQYEKACRSISQTEGVLFLSERRVEQGGNLELVRRRLLEKGECQISEFLNTKPVHKLTWGELRYSARLVAGARVVVLEDFYPQLHALTIRPETQVLQMWHACGAFKLFGLSELGLVPHLEQSTTNHRNYTMALASGQAMIPFYSEAYGVCKERIKPLGVPRTDIFFDQLYQHEIREKLLERYPVCRGKQIVLYAPTFRGSGNKTAYFPVERFPVERIVESFSDDVVLIIKNHPFVKDSWQVDEDYRDCVLDLSEGENINDLLCITSLLVTDYSSVIFEAALLHIPMLFYAFDLQDYLEERNLYFDFSSFVPGEIVSTVEELIDGVRKGLDGRGRNEKRYEEFRQFFLDALDGHSTERTVQLIRQMAGRERGEEI